MVSIRELYDFYKETRLHKSKYLNEYKYFQTAFNQLVVAIKDLTEQSEGGLFLEDFLYIYNESRVVRTIPNIKEKATTKITKTKTIKKLHTEILFDADKNWVIEPEQVFKNTIWKNHKYRKEEIALLKGVELYNRRIKYMHRRHRLFEQN